MAYGPSDHTASGSLVVDRTVENRHKAIMINMLYWDIVGGFGVVSKTQS
jgi:hypothetical protein